MRNLYTVRVCNNFSSSSFRLQSAMLRHGTWTMYVDVFAVEDRAQLYWCNRKCTEEENEENDKNITLRIKLSEEEVAAAAAVKKKWHKERKKKIAGGNVVSLTFVLCEQIIYLFVRERMCQATCNHIVYNDVAQVVSVGPGVGVCVYNTRIYRFWLEHENKSKNEKEVEKSFLGKIV